MKKNNFLFSYTDYKTFGEKNRKVSNPSKIDYNSFEKYVHCNKHYDDKKKYNRKH